MQLAISILSQYQVKLSHKLLLLQEHSHLSQARLDSTIKLYDYDIAFRWFSLNFLIRLHCLLHL